MTDHRFMRPWGLIGLAAVVILSACSTTPASVSEPTKYPLYEMPMGIARPIHTLFDNNIAWIDDERVLFEGLDRSLRDPVETNQGIPVALRSLYVWNVRTNQVVRHAAGAMRSALCFADGYVAYSIYREGNPVWFEGSFGREQETGAISEGGRNVNPFTCKSYDRAKLPKPKIGGGIEPLRDEHGWIEHTGTSTWFRGLDDKLIQLTYGGQPIGTVRPQKYSSHSRKYIFWRPSEATWLIEPGGAVVRQLPPEGSPNESRLEPAGNGRTIWRLTRINVRANWDPGESGLYLYSRDGKPPERLIRGLIEAMQVHAGGCWIAAIVDPWDREGREHRLVAVNICQ
jgi:hypothetical protein